MLVKSHLAGYGSANLQSQHFGVWGSLGYTADSEKKDKEGGESHYLKCQLPFPHSLGCGRAQTLSLCVCFSVLLKSRYIAQGINGHAGLERNDESYPRPSWLKVMITLSLKSQPYLHCGFQNLKQFSHQKWGVPSQKWNCLHLGSLTLPSTRAWPCMS